MKKIVTVIPLLAVLVAASVIPAAAAPSRPQAQADPPAACLDLVTKLSDTVKKAIAPLTAVPPDPTKVAAPLGDAVGILTEMQTAKCLPTPPVSVPEPPVALPGAPGLPTTTKFQGPEQCLSAAMNLFSIVFGLLSEVVPGAGVPDVAKLLAEVTALLKALTDTLAACDLPAPPGGLPSAPSLPSLPAPGLPIPAPGLPGLPAAA